MMDLFLRKIYTDLLKEYISKQIIDGIGFKESVTQYTHDLILDNDYSINSVEFHDSSDIIEMRTIDKKSGDAQFYLHFQMSTLKHALDLYHEFSKNIIEMKQHKDYRILLCCSGGLTTNYFAMLLNEAVEVLKLNYTIDAMGYQMVYKEGKDYDLILLAPQVSYALNQLRSVFPKKRVISIPGKVFATYDTARMLSIIHEELQKKVSVVNPKIHYKLDYNKQNPVLCLSIFRDQSIHLAYRVYHHGDHILKDNMIIKNRITIYDIYDVIDSVISEYDKIDVISIAVPGIINNGTITSMNVEGLEDCDLREFLYRRYHRKILINNDINMAAFGYGAVHEYSSLSYIFLFSGGLLGSGSVINNQVIRGNYNLAGECQFLPYHTRKERIELSDTIDGSLEIVCKAAVSFIATISPQAIIYECNLIPDPQDLEGELCKYIPAKFLPKIIKVTNSTEFVLLGLLSIALEIED